MFNINNKCTILAIKENPRKEIKLYDLISVFFVDQLLTLNFLSTFVVVQ